MPTSQPKLEEKFSTSPLPDEIFLLRAKMNALMMREQGWIRSVSARDIQDNAAAVVSEQTLRLMNKTA